MSDLVVSAIRTYVPIAVGMLLTWLGTKFGVVVPEEASNGLAIGLVGLVAGLYYAVARELEKRWPFLGVLLGVPRQPAYRQPDEG